MVIISLRIVIMMMLIRNHTRDVVMPTVHIDVLMLLTRNVSMRMAQRRQQEADASKETQDASQGGHRARV